MATKLNYIDATGKIRKVSSSYAKKNFPRKDAYDYYTDSLIDRIEKLSEGKEDEQEQIFIVPEFPVDFQPFNKIWRYEPVDSKYFFQKMIGEKLSDIQQEAADVLCAKDPFKFTNLDYKEADLFWGKRGGKDATIAKIFTYQVYKFCCLINPQQFLGMGVGSNIDMANVSKSGKQAKNVFFKYLKNFIKGSRDPKTGQNWFSKHNFWYDEGRKKFMFQNLKEGESIKQDTVDFGRGITCHSLNSETYTGEGLNLILVVIDEVGSMPPEKILGGLTGREVDVGLYDSLKTTLDATSIFSKLVCVSYKYGKNCAMSILVKRNERRQDVFISKHSTFEVRPSFDREKVKSAYIENAPKAQMMYEIADPEIDTNNFYDLPYVIDAAQDVKRRYSVNPFKDGSVIIDDIANAFVKLSDWFVGKKDTVYVAHVDLAKGQVWKGLDAIGLAVAHSEDLRVSLDVKQKRYLKERVGILNPEEMEGELKTGIVIDLACHIVCKQQDKEVRISDVRKFLINLKLHRNFDFIKITYDGWSSLESLQEFNQYGIDTALVSVDKDPVAYMTEKDLIMLGLFKIYPNRVWAREKKELLWDEKKRKVDHPDFSQVRMEQDGISHGSKDLSDSSAACAKILIEEVANQSNPVF